MRLVFTKLATMNVNLFTKLYGLRLKFISLQVAQMVLNTTRAPEKSKLLAVRKKYAHKKFGKIAEYPELTNQAVEGMANGMF